MLTPQEINQKLDSLEADMNLLVAENARLIQERISAYVERDSCIGLLSQLAVSNGLNAGTLPGNLVVIDLPAGPVSWDFEEAEAHLFAHLPQYQKPLEEIDVMEKYRRVMNPGIF